ncbi:histidine kinase [Paenibacillus luteus]|uniref:hybrid sensor histidine kinase/response regulator n=1 Tax=Paenibacillus luteus TaxID=2545753 RepID=UPI001143D240|nr:histidine kinase [Paenibacillus luteus]
MNENIQLKKYASLIIILIFLVFCLLSAKMLNQRHSPKAESGMLDLSGWEKSGESVLDLDGEWLFYPEQFLESTEDFEEASSYSSISVPGNWKSGFTGKKRNDAKGYGTYRLHIALGKEAGQIGFRVPLIRTSHRLFINGEQLGGSGEVGSQASEYAGGVEPYIAFKEIDSSTIDVVIQVANYDMSGSGGIVFPISMGPQKLIIREHINQAAFEFGMIVVFLLLAFYFALVQFQMRRNGWVYLVFLFIFTALSTANQGSRWLLSVWPTISYSTIVKLQWINALCVLYCLFLFVRIRFEEQVKIWAVRVLPGAVLFAIGLTVLLPPALFTGFLPVVSVFVIGINLYILTIMIRGTKNGKAEFIYEFLAICLFSAIAFLSALLQMGFMKLTVWYFIQIIAFLVSISCLLFVQFFRSFHKMKALRDDLKRMDVLKNNFIVNLSTQIKGPLQTIMNLIYARLNANDQLSASQEKDLQQMASVGWSTEMLVQDMMDFTRLNEEQIPLRLRQINARIALDLVIDMYSPAFAGDWKITNHISAQLPPIWADSQRFSQVMVGLFREFSGLTSQGKIIFRGTEQDQMLVIEMKIITHELSIEQVESYLEIWNEPIGKESKPHSPHPSSVLIRALLTQQNAKLHLNGAADNLLELRLSFPLATRQASDRQVESFTEQANHDTKIMWDETKNTEKATILIVDNDQLNCGVMGSVLMLDHYQTYFAASSKDARQQMSVLPEVDLVIIDQLLPDESGLELSRHFRTLYSALELPILLMTSTGYLNYGLLSHHSGVNDFIEKPVEASELRVRVQTLLQLKHAVQKRIRMEMAFLQAQIKPHFLFNTLNSIAALSKRDTGQMMALLSELGQYLRESFRFDSLEPLVPIERELKLIESYLHIEKVRYDDWLTYELDVSERGFKLPPLTLQPLVENAVRHGIMARTQGGHLLVRIHREENHICILIKDNGVGMSAEVLENVLTKPLSGGIGIANTDLRLKQWFGSGLTILSWPEEGTEVYIRLPLERMRIHEDHYSR